MARGVLGAKNERRTLKAVMRGQADGLAPCSPRDTVWFSSAPPGVVAGALLPAGQRLHHTTGHCIGRNLGWGAAWH